MDTGIRDVKYIIAGGRDFDDIEFLAWKSTAILRDFPKDIITIVSGCAKGADTLGEKFAEAMKLKVQRMPADWDKHGKAAGAIRNQQMAQEADALIAFWDGVSKGTKDMITKAINYGLEVHIYRYETS